MANTSQSEDGISISRDGEATTRASFVTTDPTSAIATCVTEGLVIRRRETLTLPGTEVILEHVEPGTC